MNDKQLRAQYEHEAANMKKRFKESLQTINPKMLIVMRKPFMVGNYSLHIERLTQPITINGIEHYRALDLTDLEKQFTQLHTAEKTKLTDEEKKNRRNEIQKRYRRKKALEKANKSILEGDSSLSAKQYDVNGLRVYPLHNARTLTHTEMSINDDSYLNEYYTYLDMCNEIVRNSHIAIGFMHIVDKEKDLMLKAIFDRHSIILSDKKFWINYYGLSQKHFDDTLKLSMEKRIRRNELLALKKPVKSSFVLKYHSYTDDELRTIRDMKDKQINADMPKIALEISKQSYKNPINPIGIIIN